MTTKRIIPGKKIVLSKRLQQKNEASKLLTPKEQCQVAHNGQCGVCRTDGTFVPCV